MAEFRGGNYWDSGSDRPRNVPRPPPKRTPQEILAASNSGNPPTLLEVQQAVKDMQDAATRQQQITGSRKLDPASAQQFNDLVYKTTPNAFRPEMFNNPLDAFKNVSAEMPYNGPSVGKTMGDAFKSGMGDILSGILGADGPVGAIVQQANDAEAAAANSPEAILRRLQEQAGNYSYNGPSAEEMAKKQFDPQFELLKSIADQTTSRYNTNKADISKMYAGLINDQTAARGEDKAMFDAAVGQTGQSYDAAGQSLANNATAYSKAMAAEMARLGIGEGAGDVVKGVQGNLTDNLGRLSQQGQTSKDLLSGLGANEYAYDTNQIGTARQAGLNTQEDFLNNYMGAMTANDQQRLQLTGQQSQAENEYGMQIQKLLSEGQAAQQGSILDQFKAIMSGNQQQTDNFYRQAGLDLDQQKFSYQQQQDALKAQNTQGPMNAYDALSQRALTQYGDPNKARAAVDEILAAYRNNPNPQNIGDFLNGLDQDALRANPEMTSLVYDFISRIMKDQKN